MNIKKLAKMSMFCALAIVSMLVIRFPLLAAAPYLNYDPGDVFLSIGSLILGPAAGVIMTFTVGLIQMISFSDSGWVGFFMYVISSTAFILPLSIIYRRNRNIKSAIIGLIVSIIAVTLVMIPANLFFTTLYNGVPFNAVVSLIIPVLIPFNLLKSTINAILILILYKRISIILKKF